MFKWCPGSSGALAARTLVRRLGQSAVRLKSANAIPIVEHYVRDYLSVEGPVDAY